MVEKVVVYLHNEILFGNQKRQIWCIVITWMGLEGIMLVEIKKKKTETRWSHLYWGIGKTNKRSRKSQNQASN